MSVSHTAYVPIPTSGFVDGQTVITSEHMQTLEGGIIKNDAELGNVIDAHNALDEKVNMYRPIIQYGANSTEQTSTRYGITCKTSPGIVHLNGDKNNTTYTLSFRIYGTISYRNGAPNSAFNVSSGAFLRAGHTYDFHMKLISGSVDEGYAIPLVYQSGTATRLNATTTAIRRPNFNDHYIYRIRMEAETEFSLSVSVDKVSSFTDAVYAIWVEDVTEGIHAMSSSIAYEEREYATKNHSVGDLIIQNGLLYRVSAAIATDEGFTVGTNVVRTTVADRLAALEARIAALENA